MDYPRIPHRSTFAFSPENLTGTRNGGTRGKDCEKLHSHVAVAPGETVTLVDADGPGMIGSMWMGGHFGHEFILRMYWDNCEYPSVECPLSAFFACAFDNQRLDRDGNALLLNSAKVLVAPNRGNNCYWEMPFRKHCKITLENIGEEEYWTYYMITGWYGEIPEDAGYFHVAYRQEHPVCKGRSYVVLDGVEGRGFLAGVALAAGINGRNTCWVEGEVKMYLDGETYPSVNYTGTEDYFCGSYAFGNDQPPYRYSTYSGHYVGMYAVLGNKDERYDAQQRFLLYRWHVTDPIYFDQSIRVVMDNFDWHSGPRYDDYTTTAYYYLDHPAPVPFELPCERELNMR